MKKTSLFIGKFNPFYEGHKAIIDSLLLEDRGVLVLPRIQMPLEEWKILYFFLKEIYGTKKVKLLNFEYFDEAVYGRDVNYQFREIKLSKRLQKVSSTKIREELYNIISKNFLGREKNK